MNKISIITISFNNLNDLIDTIASVDKQDEFPLEHIIIDGSSTPDIKNFLENTPQPAYRKWVCERDKGIADAFNKGIVMSAGDVILLLNSGDLLFDETVLQHARDVFEKDASIMWCHGKFSMLRGGLPVVVGKPFDKRKLYRGMRSLSHQTMYVKRDLYNKYGLYDPSIKMAMDYDFVCRIADEKFAFIDYPLAIYDNKGVSSTQYIQAIKDSNKQYNKYYGKSTMQVIWRWRLLLLHYILDSKFGKFLYRIKVALKLQNW
jgi:glycosyltransferase involved in cell wall biosynthesis